MKLIAGALASLLAMPVALATVITGPSGASPTAPSAVATAEIPGDLLPVYVAAAYACPGLPWQVLAGIGWVESRHAQGRADPATGQVSPPIIGPAIDGSPGFAAIPDPSQPDGWAHALGPMQFLSTTWRAWGVVSPERPPTATPDVHNAWDAIYSAALYLCGGRSQLDDLHAAVLRYNRSEEYFRQVMAKAEAYGVGADDPLAGETFAGSGEAAVAAAMTQLGVPYVWGGMTPGVGFDCSGLVQWAFAQAGVTLPRTTQQQVLVGVDVTDLAELRPGDLVFTKSLRGGVTVERGHVAIYAGGNQVIVAPRTGDVIKLRALRPEQVQVVRRVTR